jgi:hypothetical protein
MSSSRWIETVPWLGICPPPGGHRPQPSPPGEPGLTFTLRSPCAVPVQLSTVALGVDSG